MRSRPPGPRRRRSAPLSRGVAPQFAVSCFGAWRPKSQQQLSARNTKHVASHANVLGGNGVMHHQLLDRIVTRAKGPSHGRHLVCGPWAYNQRCRPSEPHFLALPARYQPGQAVVSIAVDTVLVYNVWTQNSEREIRGLRRSSSRVFDSENDAEVELIRAAESPPKSIGQSQ